MSNWTPAILAYGALGAAALLLIQWLASHLLPKLPYEVLESMRRVRQTTIDGEYQGDTDIYSLDRALMDAELERPGSTLRLYYNQPTALFGRILGSLLVSFGITGWLTGAAPYGWGIVLALLAGIAFLVYPFLTWNSSRPRLKE